MERDTLNEPDFDWDDANIEKLAAHGIEPTEAEDAILDPDAVPTRAHAAIGTPRRARIGMSEAGRIIVVVYTIRDERFRVITAFDASDQKKRQYRRGMTKS